MAAPVAERFWSHVTKGESCWVWTAAHNRDGYGAFRLDRWRGKQPAHRVSYLLTNGVIPDGMLVCHRCDNPSCVNPNHLFLGTHRDNVLDCMAKGRRAASIPPSARGSRNPRAKLTEQTVSEIRASYAAGESQRVLAMKFGVSKTAVALAVRNESWRHVTVPNR